MCHAPKKEYYKKFLFEPLPGKCCASCSGGGLVRATLPRLVSAASVPLMLPRCFAVRSGVLLTLLPSAPPPSSAVESHMDHFLHDHMAAEVVTR